MRWLQIIFTLSSVLCLASILMWIRSTVRGDSIDVKRMEFTFRMNSAGGLISLNYVNGPAPYLLSSSHRPILLSLPREAVNTNFTQGDPWTRGGFWWQREASGWGNLSGTSTWITLPYWFVTLIFAGAMFLSARPSRRQRRAIRWRAQGRCERCGYDLRASGDRCPECGTATTAAA